MQEIALKLFSKILTRNFDPYEGFRQAYSRPGPFTAIPSICNQRSLVYPKRESNAEKAFCLINDKMTIKWLLDECLTTTWQLPNDCLTIVWWLILILLVTKYIDDKIAIINYATSRFALIGVKLSCKVIQFCFFIRNWMSNSISGKCTKILNSSYR